APAVRFMQESGRENYSIAAARWDHYTVRLRDVCAPRSFDFVESRERRQREPSPLTRLRTRLERTLRSLANFRSYAVCPLSGPTAARRQALRRHHPPPPHPAQ